VAAATEIVLASGNVIESIAHNPFWAQFASPEIYGNGAGDGGAKIYERMVEAIDRSLKKESKKAYFSPAHAHRLRRHVYRRWPKMMMQAPRASWAAGSRLIC